MDPNRKLSFEPLESRVLLAGHVEVKLTSKALSIRGDDASNAIEIHRVDNQTIRIQGVSVGGAPTSINGRPNGSVTFSSNRDVICRLYGGADDRLTIEGAARTQPVTFRKRLLVYGGDGKDTLKLKYVSVLSNCEFRLDDGNDRLTLRYLYTGNNLFIRGADRAKHNSKSIDIRGNNYVTGDTTIDLGSGDDSVQIRAFRTRELSISLEAGRDALMVDFVHADHPTFRGGSGADSLLLGANDFVKRPKISGFDKLG